MRTIGKGKVVPITGNYGFEKEEYPKKTLKNARNEKNI